MPYVMKNNIPTLIKDRGVSVADLHAKILGAGERISYQSLLEIAKEEAANVPLPKGVRAGTLQLVAIALGVTLNDMIEIVEVAA